MNEMIHKIEKKKYIGESVYGEVGYTSNGKQCEVTGSLCYAKKTTSKIVGENYHGDRVILNRGVFFIKMNSGGELFDPNGLYSEGKQSSFNSDKGEGYWKFQKVNEECFEIYLRFLETSNIAHKTRAQRIYYDNQR